jgi:hypothetical protein
MAPKKAAKGRKRKQDQTEEAGIDGHVAVAAQDVGAQDDGALFAVTVPTLCISPCHLQMARLDGCDLLGFGPSLLALSWQRAAPWPSGGSLPRAYNGTAPAT